MFSSLMKAVTGVVVETPVSLLADLVTLGGSLDGKSKPYTADAISKVVENIKNSTNPRGHGG